MNTRLYKLILVCGLGWFNVANAVAEKLSFERQLALSAVGLKSLEIVKGSGTLVVLGNTSDQITVNATIESKDYSEMAEFIDIFDSRVLFYLKQNETKSQLMAKPRKSMFNTPNIQIRLHVTLPSHLNLMVDDGYGAVTIDNIAGTLNVDNEAGSLKISQIENDLLIKDGDGSIIISDIIGAVNIEDKAGSINLLDITGDVLIENKSGSIVAENISGNLTLDNESDEVIIEALAGQFKLVNDQSGKLSVNGKPWSKKLKSK